MFTDATQELSGDVSAVGPSGNKVQFARVPSTGPNNLATERETTREAEEGSSKRGN